MAKKLTSFILVFICACSFIFACSFFGVKNTKTVHGEEVQDQNNANHTVTSNVNEIFDLDKKVPEDYVKDSVSPEGRKVNDTFLSIVENELILTTSNKGSSSASVKVIDKMSLVDEKPASKEFSLGSTYGMSYTASVAFNAIGNDGGNRNSYLAYVGVSQKALMLIVVDLANQTVVSQYTFGQASWLASGSVPQFTFKHFIDITAGDFDGDGVDELAVVALTDSENSVYVFEDYTLNSYKAFSIESLVDSSKVHLDYFIKANSNKVWRPIVALSKGDFDMDDVEELAVSISTSDHMVAENVSKETITTNVALVDSPLGDVEIFKHSIASGSNNTYKLLYSSQMAVGDIDSDGVAEMIVAGYVGQVKKASTYLTNKYSISKNKIGLTTVHLVNGELVSRDVTEHSMNSFIKDGFYIDDDVWNPLAVETASLNGPQTADVVFVSGTIYDFSTQTPIEKHVFNLFKNESKKGSNAYVENVVTGNFNGDTLGREGFAFSICYKYIGQHKYSYQLGYINGTYNDDEEEGLYGFNVKYNDNSSAISGEYWINEKGGYVDTSSGHFGTNFTLASADCDDDGIQLKYLGTNYAYSDPEVKAVLQAGPYFKELGDADDFGNETTYTITTSHSKSSGVSRSFGGELGGFIGAEAGVLLAKAKTKFSIAAGGSYSWGSEKEYAKTYSDTFTAVATDTVIICRTPIKEFRYQVVNSAEQGGEYYFSTVDLRPVFYQLSVEDYNAFVDVYNAKLEEYNEKGYKNQATAFLNKIDENFLPLNTLGNPQNYYMNLPIGGTLLSSSAHAFGHNSGSTSAEYEESYTTSNTSSKSFHISAGVEVEAEAGIVFAKASAGATVGIEYSRDRSKTTSKTTAVSMGGEISNANLDTDRFPNPETIKRYNFNWQLAKWEKEIYINGTTKVPIVGYIVRDVTRPGPTAENLIAEFNNLTNKVDLSWEKSTEQTEDTLISFIIYRQVTGGNIEFIAEVGSDVTSYTEPYSNLTSRSNYTYYVSAKYLKIGTDNQYYECRSVDVANIIGGIEVSASQTWTGITALSEITGDGHYYLLDDVFDALAITITNNVVLDLNGFILEFDSSSTLITVEENASLEIYDFSNKGIVFGDTLETVGRESPMIVNYGKVIIFGGLFISNGYIFENNGSLTINMGGFYIYEGYVIENMEGGKLTVNGGEFNSYGSDKAYGIYHKGDEFIITGGGFKYLTSDIDVQKGKFITLNTIYVPNKSVSIRVLDENGNSVGGEFSNQIGNLAEFLYNTFTTLDRESDVCLSSDGRMMVCYHSFVNGDAGKAPTCEEEGYELHVCQICSSYKYVELAPLGHDYGEWIPEVPATTENYGVVAHYHCSQCNQNFDQDYKAIKALYIGKTGQSGQNGNGIVSIEKIETEGLVDTYKITFEDGTYSTFVVKYGQNAVGCSASVFGDKSNLLESVAFELLIVFGGMGLVLLLKRKIQKK